MLQDSIQRDYGLRLLLLLQDSRAEVEKFLTGSVSGHGAQDLRQSVERHLSELGPHILHILIKDVLHNALEEDS